MPRTHQFAIARRQGEWEVLKTPELIQAKAEIERLNEGLERRVVQRTRELAAANEELTREIIEHKRTEEALKATSKQLRALSASLQSAKEEEGARIARELHDELGSVLTSLRWGLEELDTLLSEKVDSAEVHRWREKLTAMTLLVEHTLDAVRRISSELRPSILDDVGLVAAIECK